jgi:hypothetical protein
MTSQYDSGPDSSKIEQVGRKLEFLFLFALMFVLLLFLLSSWSVPGTDIRSIVLFYDRTMYDSEIHVIPDSCRRPTGKRDSALEVFYTKKIKLYGVLGSHSEFVSLFFLRFTIR